MADDVVIALVEGDHFPLDGMKFKSLIEESSRGKLQYMREWDLCSLFLQGRQHVRWDRNLRNYVSQRRKPGRRTVTINMVLNIYRNLLARLSMAYPSMTVLPGSDSVEDIVKAEASETALKWYWHSGSVKEVLYDMLEWLLLTGNAGLLTYYDPDDKEIRTKAVSPYDLFFEPGVTSVSESRWCAIRHTVAKSELAASYPEHADYIQRASSTGIVEESSRMQRVVSGTQGQELKDRLEVFEVYEMGGHTGVLLNGKWLFKGSWQGGVMPLQTIQYTTIPGRLWGLGLVQPLIELQILYNQGRAQVVENADLMGNPKWLIPKTSGLSRDALSNSKPGEKVFYNANAGPAPQQIAAAPLPNYVLDNIRQLSAEMLDIAGVHSTSLGKRAIGIESGAAIEALSTKDMQQLQVTQNNIERAVRDMGGIILSMFKRYYTEDMMMRILDETGRVVFKALRGTDLVEFPEIHLESGSLFRDEKHDRDQKVLDLLKVGLIEPEVAMQELHFRTGNSYVTKKMRALSHAEEMLHAVLRGHAIEIMPTDDLKAFKQVFNDFMQTQQYYELNSDTQEYVRDILVAVATFGQEGEEQAKAMMQRTVWPPAPASQGEAAMMMSAAGSDLSQMQIAGAHDNMATRQHMADGQNNPEQGIGRTQMGGGG